MKKRIRKKRWGEQVTAQQTDLLARVAALEDLTLRMTAEQTAQREMVAEVQDGLILFRDAHLMCHEVEDERRFMRERIRYTQEIQRRKRRQEWAKLGALAAFAVAFMFFALTFPAPELTEAPEMEAQAVAVEVDPAAGVIDAMALIWED